MELTFEELKPLANQIFRVWVGHPEMDWAAQMWEFVRESGLASYDDDFERHSVLFRFLALGGIYQDFCMVAFDERHGTDYASWVAYGLEEDGPQVDWFIIGQLATGVESGRNGPPFYADERHQALVCLVEQHRHEVWDVIVKGTGWEYELLISLCGSRVSADEDVWDDDDCDEPHPTRDGEDVLASLNVWQAANVYDWIQVGCPARQFLYERID